MSKAIAILSISALMFLSTLGNFWFTYGIWPKSWWAFFGFCLINVFLLGLMTVVSKED